MRFIYIFLIHIAFWLPLKSQTVEDITSNLYRQLQRFPQEKLYLLTDKTTYVAGEHIWFRAFLTDAILHCENAAISRYVYIDLIDPEGNICKHHLIHPDSNNVFHNRIELDDDMAEGTYRMRAYTSYMRSKPEYFFEKKLFIADPQSPLIAVEPQFTITGKRKVSVLFRFRNLLDSSFLPIEHVKIKGRDTKFKTFSTGRPISFRVHPDKDKHFCVAFTYRNKQFQKFISIPYSNPIPFDVSFFPEGGWLIPGIPAKIGFKALRYDGLSEEITGEIYDSNNQHIGSIQSLHAGMGYFTLTPESGKTYYALCTNKNNLTLRFSLPAVQPNASVIQVIAHNGQFEISTHGNGLTQENDLFLIIHMRGMVYYAQKMPPNHRVVLQTEGIPSGILQILLLDNQLNPLSERLIFHRQHDFAKAEITPDQSSYGKRAPVKMDITIDALEGFSNSGFVAVSVTDDHDILPDTAMTLTSYLLISSELRGNIEDAGFYLSDDPAASDALDALMLTQGWRRYDIPSAAKGLIEAPERYPETGQKLSGSVTANRESGKRVSDAFVQIVAPEMPFFKEVRTNPSGRFECADLSFPDSTLFLIMAFNPQEPYVTLKVDPDSPLLTANAMVTWPHERDDRFNRYITKADQKFMDEYGARSYEKTQPTVSAKTKSDEWSLFSSATVAYTVDLDIINLYKRDIVPLLLSIPNVNITEEGRVVIGQNHNETEFTGMPLPALLVIDDWIYSNPDIRDLAGVPIKGVEMLADKDSPFFGVSSRGMGGAILITTDRTNSRYDKFLDLPLLRSRATVKPLGFKKAETFYSPKYETQNQRQSLKSDLRTTIHWEPDVQIINGTGTVTFYTADGNNTSYSIVLEGITTDGTIIRQTGKIYIH